MNYLLTILLLMSLNLQSANAQITQEWVTRYNGPGNNSDEAYSITIDALGNIYVTGGSKSSSAGTSFDFATIKYNTSGVQQWVSRYNGTGNSSDESVSIALDNQENIYVTGYSYGAGTDMDYATIKYNSSGIQQWVSRYNSSDMNTDNPQALAVDDLGNTYVTGFSYGTGTAWDYATIKYDSLGVEQWVSRYNGTGNNYDRAYAIAVDGLGNVYVTGESEGISTAQDYATIKYNFSGAVQWVSRYNGTENGPDIARAISVDSIGNVYVTGFSWGAVTAYDYTTIKYNSSGVEQWVSIYNGPGNSSDNASSLKIDRKNNVYVTGQSAGIGTIADFATIKYNSTGAEQWVSRYNGTGNLNDVANSIAVDISGSVYVTGSSRGTGILEDYATVKYNSLGLQQWVIRYNGTGNNDDQPHSIAVSNSGENIYVTGQSWGSSSLYDYATVKYSQTVGIEQHSYEIPGKFTLLQNHPNPFNPITQIKYVLSSSNYEHVSLKIFDALGKEVADLVNQSQNAGVYSVNFDGTNIASGVYFYRLVVISDKIGNELNFESKKMFLNK